VGSEALARTMLALLIALAMGGCDGDADTDPCRGVRCSNHGSCVREGSAARCDCDDGYLPSELECVPPGSDGDSDADTDGGDGDVDEDLDADSPVDGEVDRDGETDGDEIADCPVRLGALPALAAAGRVLAVALSEDGQRAFVVAHGVVVTFMVVDVSDPAAPAELGRVATEICGLCESGSVQVRGTHALFVAGNLGTEVVDVSNPAQPRIVHSVSAGRTGRSWRSALVGDRLYEAMREGGVRILDVSGLPAAAEISTVPNPPEHTVDVAANETLAFGAFGRLEEQSGLFVFGVSDPAEPWRYGEVHTEPRVRAIELLGGNAYLGLDDVAAGLAVVDLANPMRPAVVASFPIGAVWALERVGEHLLAGGESLRILDLSDPTSPLLLAEAEGAGTVEGIAARGTYVYVAAGAEGLEIFDVSCLGIEL